MKLLAPRFKCKECGATGQHNIVSKFVGTVKGAALIMLNVDAKTMCRNCRKETPIQGEIPVGQDA